MITEELLKLETLQAKLDEAQKSLAIAVEALRDIQEFVNEQAEDEGLWSIPIDVPQSIGEAMLQQGLRALHAKIESHTEALSRIGNGEKGEK